MKLRYILVISAGLMVGATVRASPGRQWRESELDKSSPLPATAEEIQNLDRKFRTEMIRLALRQWEGVSSLKYTAEEFSGELPQGWIISEKDPQLVLLHFKMKMTPAGHEPIGPMIVVRDNQMQLLSGLCTRQLGFYEKAQEPYIGLMNFCCECDWATEALYRIGKKENTEVESHGMSDDATRTSTWSIKNPKKGRSTAGLKSFLDYIGGFVK